MKSSFAQTARLARMVRIGGLLLALSVGTASVIYAQTPAPEQGESEKMAKPKKAKSTQTPLDRSVSELTERLKLTQEQADQIRPIIADRMEKQHALRVKYKSDRKGYMAEEKKMQETHVKQIEAVLTPDQVTEYQKFMQEQKSKMRTGTKKAASKKSSK